MKLNYKDYRNLSICISIICLWTMILFFLVKIVNTKVDEFKYIENEEQIKLVAYNDFMTKNNNDIDAYRQKLKVNYDLLQAKIPDDLAQNQFLAQLNEIGQLSKIDIVELTPKEIINKEAYRQQEFSLTIQGDYFAILDFCRQLNLSNRLVSIQYGKIFIQNQMINANLTLQIYANN